MNPITRILVKLGLMKEPTIETIVSPISKIQANLEAYAADQARRAEIEAENASKLLETSKKRSTAAFDARALAERYSGFAKISAIAAE